ncbi:MAG: hypothetical protein EBQ99_11165 [Planctomycetes bacterium]|nr:hypothetical protein [Planctomycetota bacterium]
MDAPPPPVLNAPPPRAAARQRGFLPPNAVRAFAFWVITLCVLVSVVASIMAIWQFAQDGVLWRTIGTCAVIAFGSMVFAVVNMSFGASESGH